jgi:hypothetical protein
MKSLFICLSVIFVLCPLGLCAQDTPKKEKKPAYIYFEYGRGISLTRPNTFDGYNPGVFPIYGLRRFTLGRMKNHKKMGVELNVAIDKREDDFDGFFYTRFPIRIYMNGFYLVDVVKKDKFSLFVGPMGGIVGHINEMYRFDDRRYIRADENGWNLHFRGDMQYLFTENLYALFTMSFNVIQITRFNIFFNEQGLPYRERFIESGTHFATPFIGNINANLALGFRF